MRVFFVLTLLAVAYAYPTENKHQESQPQPTAEKEVHHHHHKPAEIVPHHHHQKPAENVNNNQKPIDKPVEAVYGQPMEGHKMENVHNHKKPAMPVENIQAINKPAEIVHPVPAAVVEAEKPKDEVKEEVKIPEDKYTTAYDNYNVDEVLESKRLMENFVNCALGKGPCTKEGALLKDHVPDALKTECSKCSEKQKDSIRKVFHRLIEKYPDLFKLLEDKFDHEGTYRKKYHEVAEKEGIKLTY